jgi:hypothetical protein
MKRTRRYFAKPEVIKHLHVKRLLCNKKKDRFENWTLTSYVLLFIISLIYNAMSFLLYLPTWLMVALFYDIFIFPSLSWFMKVIPETRLYYPQTLELYDFSNLSFLSVPDEDYSRNASCALNLISTFLLPSLGRYISLWTNHPSSSQCFVTDVVY